MKFSSVSILWLALAALPVTNEAFHPCFADEVDEVTPESAWNKYCRKSMSRYTVREREGDEKEFKRIPYAVMQHHNPANNDRGLIYLWTQDNGVPVVIISAIVQNYQKGTLKELHEFHSLHDGPPHVKPTKGRAFTPTAPGLTWKPLPNSPDPAISVRQQQLQSRALSRKFRGIMKHPRVGDVRLHVTTRPLHQYEINEGDVVRTGSLFAVSNATDPEALLMLEVRKNDSGEPKWHFACAGYTAWGTHIYYEDKEISADDPADFSKVHKGFFVRRGFTLPETDAPAAR